MGDVVEHRRAVLGAHYGTVLFPFDLWRFLLKLGSVGYVVPRELRTALPGGQFNADGPVARRMDSVVVVRSAANSLQVADVGPAACLDDLNRIEQLLLSELEFDSRAAARFYELVAEIDVKAAASPIKAWARLSASTAIVSTLSRVFGADLGVFGVRLVPAGSVPNQEEWLDVRLEPSVQEPERAHYLQTVFRSRNRLDVETFIANLDERVKRLVELVEQG